MLVGQKIIDLQLMADVLKCYLNQLNVKMAPPRPFSFLKSNHS